MADSEEFRLKRLKHEEQMSRMFDEVMGLGDFADSSRGSVASSKSGGQTEAKGPSETLGLKENQPRDEDSSCSRKEGKMDEGTGERNFPCRTSNKPSLFNMGGGVGGSGEAAFDDALDGLPLYGQEEEDEDWHFALPLDSTEDGDARKTNSNISQFGPQSSSPRGGPFPRKPADEEEEQQEGEGSGESANTSHSSQDNTPDNSRDVLNQTEETEDSQQAETAEARPAEDSNPPASPGVKIKDEPIDEGYNAALLPQSSIRQIKEELEQQEEELRISSVYSVGGANTFTSPAMPAAIPIPTPTPTAIFIPGRGAVLQAMAPLPIRPPAVLQPPVPTLTAIPPRPPQPPAPGSVRCSGCTKVLLKGQTAFQRKGSTQLFCSTSCLTGHLPPATKYRSCFQCNREILQPRDMVTIPGEENTYLQFCGQFCLSVFRHKRVQGDKIIDKRLVKKPQKPPEKPVERLPEKPICSVCKSTNKQIEHEVNHQGRLHKLCSNACFLAWRRLRQLAMNCCEGCGLYCNSSSGSCQMLTIEKTQLNFCSPTCVGTYKLTCRKMTECSNCHKSVLVSGTIMERDHKGKVQLYCSPSCVEQSRPPQHALSGTPFPCCLCKVSAVPQYHLAMVDGTIRNFCSYNCVSMFRKLGHVPQPELTNGTSSLRDPPSKDAPRPAPSAGASSVPPVPQDYPSSVPSHHSTHTSVPSLVPPPSVTSSPTAPGQVQAQSPPDETQKPTAGRFGDAVRVTCHQCSKQFSTKPLLLSHQGRISVFCCKTCSDQYKTQKNIVAPCESCKQEKVIYENFNYNQQDLFFCSENCKLLFKGDHQWRPCTYCSAVGDKMVLSHYGGKTEEFCRPHCMSQFTVLYYGMGRCDGCRKQGYMLEKLQCLGSVRNFCNMSCLLQYCYAHFEMSQHTSTNGTVPQMPSAPAQPHLSSKMNPVIGDVVSLANGSAAQPSVSADTSLSGALPASSVDGKNLDHASTQTDAMRVPAPRRRQMKNKSVLCRPFTLDQESTCQLLTAASESDALLDSSLLSTGVPARLTGRHFLGRRENSSDCMVCSRHKKKKRRRRRRVVEGEGAVGKKQKIEDGRETMEEDGRETMEEDGRETMEEDGRETMEEDGRETMEEDGRETMEEDGRKTMEEDGRKTMEEDGRETMEEDGRETMEEDVREKKIEEVSKRKEDDDPGSQKEDNPEGQKGNELERIKEDDPEREREDIPEMLKENKDTDKKMEMEQDNLERKNESDPESKREDEEDGMSSSSEEETDEEDSEISRTGSETCYYCKTCPEEPSLCPVPCFELYHTQLVYRTAPELEAQAPPREEEKDRVKMVMVPVPVPVPVFVPVPVNIYPQLAPVSMVIPMPVPVPIVASPKDTKDAEVQFEMLPEEEKKQEIVDVSSSDQGCSSEVVQEDEEAPGAADPPQPEFSETLDLQPEFSETLDLQPEISKTAEHPPACSTKDQPPSSPLMDLEADIPPEPVIRKVPVQQRGVKRPRDCSYNRKRGRRRTGPAGRGALAAPVAPKLNHLYGVKAWRSWVQQRNKDPQESSRVAVKDDILQCNSAELSFALSDFIREVRRPNGDAYSPDSIFYLCLGIQQYLFEQGRIENIFTDELYSPFTSEISGMLRLWRPKLLPSGGVVPSRVVESYLWECKQLGAYSPIVLLNTLLFFFTKTFHLTTVNQHQRLSFSSLTLRSKPCSRAGKVTSLVYRGGTATSGSEPTERFRKRPAENVGELELLEKTSNPLQCPVRLYEFYLSRCPESVKKRADAFYLQPERRVQTESPHWYSRHPLDANTLQSMLTRILAVREVQQEAERAGARLQPMGSEQQTDSLV